MPTVSFNRDTSKDKTLYTVPPTVYTDSTTLTNGMTLYDNTGNDTGYVVTNINNNTFDILPPNSSIICFDGSQDQRLVSYTIDGISYTGVNNVIVSNNEQHTLNCLCDGDYILLNGTTVSVYFGGSTLKTHYLTFITDGSSVTYSSNYSYTTSVSTPIVITVEGCCIPYYTEVNYYDGTTKTAENVKVGDKLLGYNELTKQFEEAEVLNIIHKLRKELVIVKTENYEIEITPDHPILTNKGWAVYDTNIDNYKSIEKIPLTNDLKVLTKDGDYEDIISIDYRELENPIDTYTYDVTDGIDTYVAAGFISHNEKC